MAEERGKRQTPNRTQAGSERESENERRKLDGHSKRQAKRAKLHGARPEVPHGPADGEAIARAIAAAHRAGVAGRGGAACHRLLTLHISKIPLENI